MALGGIIFFVFFLSCFVLSWVARFKVKQKPPDDEKGGRMIVRRHDDREDGEGEMVVSLDGPLVCSKCRGKAEKEDALAAADCIAAPSGQASRKFGLGNAAFAIGSGVAPPKTPSPRKAFKPKSGSKKNLPRVGESFGVFLPLSEEEAEGKKAFGFPNPDDSDPSFPRPSAPPGVDALSGPNFDLFEAQANEDIVAGQAQLLASFSEPPRNASELEQEERLLEKKLTEVKLRMKLDSLATQLTDLLDEPGGLDHYPNKRQHHQPGMSHASDLSSCAVIRRGSRAGLGSARTEPLPGIPEGDKDMLLAHALSLRALQVPGDLAPGGASSPAESCRSEGHPTVTRSKAK